ncbi:hypothetical protein [Paenibacillus periandrae]|uniref:hypothetical protein n=1 Tax=Paenibacillus periandrae TaxID=1761741 RepID=UPI001F08A0B5|nr:hypothetical protein [Paenibacillus periandrae]
MSQVQQRQFLHNMYFYNRMFNFEVYTLLQSMINCNASVLVHGRKGSGSDELLKTLFDAKSLGGTTLFLGSECIKGLYPKRRIMEFTGSWDGDDFSPAFNEATSVVVNGLTAQNVRPFLEMCKRGQGLAALDGHTVNFALDEIASLLGEDHELQSEIGAIDFVLTVEAHKLVSVSEVIKSDGILTLQPFAVYVGGNEYSFQACVSDNKINKMRNANFEEAERFMLSIRHYEAE